jgi:NAD(P)-dependent dehydrogenase (short-subunit alcohol dehydrogenase family)
LIYAQNHQISFYKKGQNMKIALVGGTGDIGTGFALRWAAHHEIVIGSRRAEKALQRTAGAWNAGRGKSLWNGQ